MTTAWGGQTGTEMPSLLFLAPWNGSGLFPSLCALEQTSQRWAPGSDPPRPHSRLHWSASAVTASDPGWVFFSPLLVLQHL